MINHERVNLVFTYKVENESLGTATSRGAGEQDGN